MAADIWQWESCLQCKTACGVVLVDGGGPWGHTCLCLVPAHTARTASPWWRAHPCCNVARRTVDLQQTCRGMWCVAPGLHCPLARQQVVWHHSVCRDCHTSVSLRMLPLCCYDGSRLRITQGSCGVAHRDSVIVKLYLIG